MWQRSCHVRQLLMFFCHWVCTVLMSYMLQLLHCTTLKLCSTCKLRDAAPMVCLYACRAKEQFLIQWQLNTRTKWVKRLNLILLDEDRAAFRFRLKQAQRRRDEVGSKLARFAHAVLASPASCPESVLLHLTAG